MPTTQGKSLPRRMIAAIAATLTIMVLAAAWAPTAEAQTRRYACWDSSTWWSPTSQQSMYPRENLDNKWPIAILYRGETFDIYDSVRQSNGALWFYGRIWGGEPNAWGWVYQYWVTQSDGYCYRG